MGDYCNPERSGIRRRGQKALYQRLGLLSVTRPLGLFSHWIAQVFLRGTRKYIRRPDRISTSQTSIRQPILQDPKQQLVSLMDFTDSTHANVSYPEENLRPPGTEGHERASSSISSPWKSFTGQCGTHQIQVGSPTTTAGFCQSIVVDLSNSPSPQSPQFRRHRLQGVSNRGSLESRDRMFHNKINRRKGPSIEFHESQYQQAMLDNQKNSQELKALRNENHRLRLFVVASENTVNELELNLEASENTARGLVGDLQALTRKTHEVEQDLKRCRKSSQASLAAIIEEKHDEIISLNENVQYLSAELEKISREHQSCEKSTSTRSEVYAAHNAMCGSYVDESATPSLLSTALSITKAAVTRFLKAFAEALRRNYDPASIVDLLKPDAHDARDSHVSYAVRALVYKVLFDGFENESFNTCSGISRFLDPGVRLAKFYEYYLRVKEQDHSSGDSQFEAFCEMKVPRLWGKFNLRLENNGASMQVACLEALGGSPLLSSFRVAAMSVWLLHKLAFSFEPPASIFRVEQGAPVDLDYMQPVVNLEDSDRFVNEVGFMIAPGLRLRKTVLRCEVYLSVTVVLGLEDDVMLSEDSQVLRKAKQSKYFTLRELHRAGKCH